MAVKGSERDDRKGFWDHRIEAFVCAVTIFKQDILVLPRTIRWSVVESIPVWWQDYLDGEVEGWMPFAYYRRIRWMISADSEVPVWEGGVDINRLWSPRGRLLQLVLWETTPYTCSRKVVVSHKDNERSAPKTTLRVEAGSQHNMKGSMQWNLWWNDEIAGRSCNGTPIATYWTTRTEPTLTDNSEGQCSARYMH